MADYKEILYEKQRGGVLITLNRPEAMNAHRGAIGDGPNDRRGPGDREPGDRSRCVSSHEGSATVRPTHRVTGRYDDRPPMRAGAADPRPPAFGMVGRCRTRPGLRRMMA